MTNFFTQMPFTSRPLVRATVNLIKRNKRKAIAITTLFTLSSYAGYHFYKSHNYSPQVSSNPSAITQQIPQLISTPVPTPQPTPLYQTSIIDIENTKTTGEDYKTTISPVEVDGKTYPVKTLEKNEKVIVNNEQIPTSLDFYLIKKDSIEIDPTNKKIDVTGQAYPIVPIKDIPNDNLHYEIVKDGKLEEITIRTGFPFRLNTLEGKIKIENNSFNIPTIKERGEEYYIMPNGFAYIGNEAPLAILFPKKTTKIKLDEKSEKIILKGFAYTTMQGEIISEQEYSKKLKHTGAEGKGQYLETPSQTPLSITPSITQDTKQILIPNPRYQQDLPEVDVNGLE